MADITEDEAVLHLKKALGLGLNVLSSTQSTCLDFAICVWERFVCLS